MNNQRIENIHEAIEYLDTQMGILKGYIADDKNIKMDIEFAKIKLLEKKFYLLAELRVLLMK